VTRTKLATVVEATVIATTLQILLLPACVSGLTSSPEGSIYKINTGLATQWNNHNIFNIQMK